MPIKWCARRWAREANEDKWAHIWHANRQHIVLWLPAHTFCLKSNTQTIPQLWYTVIPVATESHSLQFSFLGLVCKTGWMTGSQTTYCLMSWSSVITNKSGRENIIKPHYLPSWSTVEHCWWLRSDSREREKKKKTAVACKLLNRKELNLCKNVM